MIMNPVWLYIAIGVAVLILIAAFYWKAHKRISEAEARQKTKLKKQRLIKNVKN